MLIKNKRRSIWQLIRFIGNRSETWLHIKGALQRGRTCQKRSKLHQNILKLQRLLKSFHQQYTISSKDSENQESKLDVCDLKALRLHCIKNRHNSPLDIAAQTQDHFQKSQSVNTFHSSIHITAVSCKEEYVNTIQNCRHLLWTRSHLKLFCVSDES